MLHCGDFLLLPTTQSVIFLKEIDIVLEGVLTIEAGVTEKIALLQKGALVAQDPPNSEAVELLDNFETEALRNEIVCRWGQQKSLYYGVCGCRALLLITFPQMAWLLVAGLRFIISEENRAQLGHIAFISLLFATPPAKVLSPGSLPPLRSCSRGSGAVHHFSKALKGGHPVGAFYFYVGLNVTALGLISLFMPETKQRTLRS